MPTLLVIFFAALLFAVAATPIARRLAFALGILDQPNARKVHSSPVPLLGGLAIYVSFVAALLLFSDSFYVTQVIGILLGATWVSLLGIWDDWRTLRPLVKLAGQFFAIAILIVTGVQVEFLRNPFLNILITALWIVGITNAVNFLDNMDGLSGGVAAIAAGWFLILSILNGQVLVAPFAAALLGASLGFLVYNFNPARIFMGDAGSLFLGFTLAAVGLKLRFPGHPDAVTWMIPILVLGVPILDMTLVTISRLRRHVNPWTTAGKDHLSHRLVKLGMSHRRAVLTIYALCGITGALGLAVEFVSPELAYAIFALAFFCGGLVIFFFERNVSS
ncbi:MAG: undecaprenyl/decaprenyl-phosphate alpha-N-acetylglucosaminyl 1-phosphate transferase [Chloroflexota bacterium]|nr:MAG: undecaprenyl/decaprenyl-phosphate alpha-N-acetylglucosaminyl 1-phosphate transferase [Chloroflexota bacterium]